MHELEKRTGRFQSDPLRCFDDWPNLDRPFIANGDVPASFGHFLKRSGGDGSLRGAQKGTRTGRRRMGRKVTPDEKLRLVQEWRELGMSRRNFCYLRNIPLTTFCKWVRGLNLGLQGKAKLPKRAIL